MKWTEAEVAAENERHYKSLIRDIEHRLEDIDPTTSPEKRREAKEALEGCYANLAVALYAQGKLFDCIEAARKAIPAWRDQFLPRIVGIREAILRLDQTDCDCMPGVEEHKKFTVEVNGNTFLLHCVECGKYHARSSLSEELGKIENIRELLKHNKEQSKSIPDSKSL